MIYKRAAARLRAQDWLAITIEFAIVVAGVFVGTQVSNWNATRLEGAETQHRLDQLKPELRRIVARAALVRDYYATTRRYAETAFAGWENDPKVSDNAFVIAAYQASQIKAMSTTSQSWAANTRPKTPAGQSQHARPIGCPSFIVGSAGLLIEMGEGLYAPTVAALEPAKA